MTEQKAKQLNNGEQRIFLGWGVPLLPHACRWLLQEHARNGHFDLSGLILVLPTFRARQRMLQLLIFEAQQRKVFFTPPTFATVGELPEMLYPVTQSMATDLAQQVAWAKALDKTPAHEIEAIVKEPKPSLDDWQPLAKLLSRLHQRLANDVWSFNSVAREVGKLADFPRHERNRWNALKEIQGRYYDLLREVGLWDRQAARSVAVRRQLCSIDRQIILIGTADLNRSTTEMLAQVSSQVTSLVAAPIELAERFDRFGSLKTEAWLDVAVDVRDDEIRIVDQPADQAFAAAHFISSLGIDVSTDQITIGVADPAVVPQLQRTLNAMKVPHRSLAGRPLIETPPVRLMRAAGEYLQSQSFSAFASLVRHPDVFDWLCSHLQQPANWLSDLDEIQHCSLPDEIAISAKQPFGDPPRVNQHLKEDDLKSREQCQNRASSVARLNLIHGKLRSVLKSLTGRPKTIASWTEPWSQLLLAIYGGRELNREDPIERQTIQACDAIYVALADQRQVPDQWKIQVSATKALEFALQAVAEGHVVPPPIPAAIELAGWLDLALDDAPVMVVTGMNDNFVPTSENGHLFLPNSLCQKLGILDNNRRYARDAYALTAIRSARDHVLFIAGRRDEEGEPLKPSRLLFNGDNQTVARRAKAYFGYRGKPESQAWLGGDLPVRQTQGIAIPRPEDVPVLEAMRVTAFRQYVQCPYRFYLNVILKLKSAADDWRELDGASFGTLAHQVVQDFGNSDAKDSDDVDQIRQVLNDQLSTRMARDFQGSRLPAVCIQIEQLRSRLERFAECQAQQRRQGWQIVAVEQSLEHVMQVDGLPFTIRGTIDRIDVNNRTQAVAVWDYKTSDKGDSPDTVHWSSRNRQWKDLQLPLYRHLASQLDLLKNANVEQLQLGYILLPKTLDEIEFAAAQWTAGQLASADELASDIIRKVRQRLFWPPNLIPPEYSEDFSGICQDHVFEQFQLTDATAESQYAILPENRQ